MNSAQHVLLKALQNVQTQIKDLESKITEFSNYVVKNQHDLVKLKNSEKELQDALQKLEVQNESENQSKKATPRSKAPSKKS